jgi:hypothetical protein
MAFLHNVAVFLYMAASQRRIERRIMRKLLEYV